MAGTAPPSGDRHRDELREMLAEVLPTNRFYAAKFAGLSPDTPLSELPFTTKAELVADQKAHPPYGSNLTHSLERYSRLCQTSGTSTGRPLRWLDTPESWAWLLGCWEAVFGRAGVTAADRVMFPFSFGPFLGFWTAFEAAARMGCLCLPAGGMSSTARLRFLLDHEATAVCCTPTYALHLAEVAVGEGIDLASGPVRRVIVAGEPGGAIPATRERIARTWGAAVIDHYGMTEVGPVAVESPAVPGGMDVLDDRFIAELVEPNGADPAPAGGVGELVLTNLGRRGSPLIRYRTGDLVRTTSGPRLEGGILGRADDMIHLRGNNVYPSAIEAVIRRFADVAEFRLTLQNIGPMSDLRIEVEPTPGGDGPEIARRVGSALRDELLFRTDVTDVPPGTLPRFELKAKRLVKPPTEDSPR